MARISIWLLATVAAVNLASAVPMPGENDSTAKAFLQHDSEQTTMPSGGTALQSAQQLTPLERKEKNIKALTKLRSFLGLPTDETESVNLIALRTLLDGAQFEFRDMIYKFNTWIRSDSKGRETKEREYPDLFKGYTPPPTSALVYDNPWFKEPYSTGYIKLSDIKHGLFKIVGRYKTPSIIEIVKLLLQTSTGEYLWRDFLFIGDIPLDEMNLVSNFWSLFHQGLAQPKHYRSMHHQFWFEVICDSRPKELQYYLTNMLVFDVIPLLISRKLYDNVDGALELASGISQLEEFTGYVGAYYDEDYRDNAPNYHEFM
ncbi:hypothetical protein H4R34_005721, partial [Dimargaris verticillata]